MKNNKIFELRFISREKNMAFFGFEKIYVVLSWHFWKY